MLARIIRAIKLDATLYREVRDNPALDQEALIIVLLVAAINSGLGFLFTAFFSLIFGGAGLFMVSLTNAVIGFGVSIALFFIGAYLIWYLGVNFFNGKGTPEGVRRALAYAYAPNIIGAIPCIGLLGVVWGLVTFYVAIRESLELDSTQAALLLVSYIVLGFIAVFVLGSMGIGFGMGFGALGRR